MSDHLSQTNDLQNVDRFKNEVVFSLDENRHGDDGVDIEFDKQFEYLRIGPKGPQSKGD